MDEKYTISDGTLSIATRVDRWGVPVEASAETILGFMEERMIVPDWMPSELEKVAEYRLRRLFTLPTVIDTTNCPF